MFHNQLLWFYGAIIWHFNTYMVNDKKFKFQKMTTIDVDNIWYLRHMKRMTASFTKFTSCQKSRTNWKQSITNTKSHTKSKAQWNIVSLSKAGSPNQSLFPKYCSFFFYEYKIGDIQKTCWCTSSLCNAMLLQHELFVEKNSN